jgi:hypothetical protein
VPCCLPRHVSCDGACADTDTYGEVIELTSAGGATPESDGGPDAVPLPLPRADADGELDVGVSCRGCGFGFKVTPGDVGPVS